MKTEELKITEKMLLDWLGSDNTLKESLSVVLAVANGTYTPKLLREEIISYDDNFKESEVAQ